MSDNPLYVLMSLPEFVRDSKKDYETFREGAEILADLITDGLIVYLGNGQAKLTEAGRRAAKDPNHVLEKNGAHVKLQEITNFLSGRKRI